jgi:hypothetical protein
VKRADLAGLREVGPGRTGKSLIRQLVKSMHLMVGMTKAPNLPVPSAEISRYQDGWRRGKPEEDPEKTKRWGVISAKPSEFLIRMRGGEVTTSGQGRTVFKWPWESVAIVPTTVQRLHFVADQITREKVGVKVTGIAVYRIAEPLIAFRMLNFSFPERAQEKLAEMMEELCTGASRRLIANLTVEQCLTERKAALAGELIREIAPVVEGQGQRQGVLQRHHADLDTDTPTQTRQKHT